MGNSIEDYSHPYSVAVGNFNNDKWLDIVVANFGANNVGVFLGVGNGTFAPQQIYSTGFNSRPYSIAVGDFNNDDHLDIAVANYGSNSICILFGTGDGTFGNSKAFFLNSSRPTFIALGDFNNDHFLDMAVANNGTNNIAILLGDGNGIFQAPITYFTGYDSFPNSIAVGDFNNDRILDVAVANYGTNNVYILLGYGNGTFATQMILPTGLNSHPSSIAVDYFNEDIYLDIVVANSGTNQLGVLLGYGNGTFAPQKMYFMGYGSNPSFVTVGDFDNDRRLDIAASNTGNYNVSILLGYGNGIFAAPIAHSISFKSNPFGIASGDFDNDNLSDIVVTNFQTNNILILTNFATVPSQTPMTYSLHSGSSPYQVLIDDLNNDTYLDIIVVDEGTNDVGIFLGYGNGSFPQMVTYSTGNSSGPIAFAISDFNNDSHLDIIVCNLHSNTLGLLLGYGNGIFADVITYFFGEYFSPACIAVGDFNKDGKYDLVVANFGLNTISIILGYEHETFNLSEAYSTGPDSRPYHVSVGDFNNDNILDIVTANYGSNSVAIYLGYGNGKFGEITIYSSGYASIPCSVTIDDFNNDNIQDIAVANSNTGNVGILLGYGNGTFASLTTFPTGSGSMPVALVTGDMNNDGCKDIVVANYAINSIGVLIGNCDGTFGSQLEFPTGSNSNPNSVAIGKLNSDNCYDAVSANYGGNSVTVLLSSQCPIRKTLINYSNNSTSQWSSFDMGEFENGMNSQHALLLGDYYSDFHSERSYSTSHSLHPYSATVGYFNSDNHLDIAISNSRNESISILLGYGNGSFATEQKYSTGSGSRPENLIVVNISQEKEPYIIVTDSIQDRITILRGSGDGTFDIETTVLTGSGSSPNSVAAGYINNDRFLDLVVANPGTDTIGLVLGFRYTICKIGMEYSTGDYSHPLSMAIGDLNNDNQLDIAIANSFTDNVGVLFGNGDGTFRQQIQYPLKIGSSPMAIVLADFNNDTNLDIATINWGSESISILLGYGNETFATPLYYKTVLPARPLGINVGDFNNDNYLDIVASNHGADSVSVFLGNGNGSFDNYAIYSTGPASVPYAVTVYDLNKDNNMDIIIANPGTDNIGIFFGYGNGKFQNVTLISVRRGAAPRHTAVADVNNDGRPDIAIACTGNGEIGILLGYENGSFKTVVTYTTNVPSGVTYVSIHDFNKDSYLDVITANSGNGFINIFYGYGNGDFTSAVQYLIHQNSAINWLGIGDFNNDGSPEIAYADNKNNKIGTVLASKTTYFGGQIGLPLSKGSRPLSVAIGDLNNDKYLDIVVANSGTNNIGIFLGQGNGNFQSIILYSTGNDSHPSNIAVHDLNNDTVLDIVVANSGTDNIAIFFGYGNGNFSSFVLYSTGLGSHPVSFTIGNFNNDTILDIVVANFGTNNIGVFRGIGNGTFSNQTSYSVTYGSHPHSVILADVNEDTYMDIVATNYDTDTTVLILNTC